MPSYRHEESDINKGDKYPTATMSQLQEILNSIKNTPDRKDLTFQRYVSVLTPSDDVGVLFPLMVLAFWRPLLVLVF
jgi:hypothetical protein